LDQTRRRDPNRFRTASEPIDLGNEPPLLVEGHTTTGLVDRRRVSVQWFSGTILTGLCGAALMGGAVYVALDGETNFAALPERVEAVLRGTLTGNERIAAGPRKSDRLPPAGEINSARQTFKISAPSRAGDREIMRARAYTRVASNLSLSVTEISANVPPFNPARLLMDNGRGNAVLAEDTAAAAPDAEVSFVTRDLTTVLPKAKVAAVVPLDEVLARVRDAAEWFGGVKRPGIIAPDQPVPGGRTRLGYATEGTEIDPYAGFEARIVPENITLLPKSPTQANGNPWNERTIAVKKNETATSILRDLNATPDEIRAIVALLGPRGRDGGLREGQKLRLLFTAVDGGQRQRVVRLVVVGDSAIEAVVALSDTGKYVSVDVQHGGPEVADASNDDDENDTSAVRLYQSVYETALRNQVPRPVIDDMIRVYSYDVDFQRKAQPGDSFEVLYSGDDEADTRSEVLFASLTVGGETKRFYRFQSPDDGVVDYYDETGKSAKKFLVRKPVGPGIMRSGFGFRRHPILGYSKMHTGVDWGAAFGTPIFASGNGMVEKAGWEGGYGKYVRIKHNNGYETAYGHMSAFAKGIEPGKRVRQGQVIGFVGSTGLSTGAHVHYEIVVNGRFVDPMRIRLPRGRVLEGTMLANFEKERDKFEGMMSRKAQVTAPVAPGRVVRAGN
jgi:murein DD-endopeptidase MepM/ murein hydrolase activator NlpD